MQKFILNRQLFLFITLLLNIVILSGCNNEAKSNSAADTSNIQFQDLGLNESNDSGNISEYLYALDKSSRSILMYLVNADGKLSALTTAKISIGHGPWSITVSPNNLYAYVPCADDQLVALYKINPSSGVLKWQGLDYKIGGGIQPHHIVFTQDGNYGYISAYNNKQIILVKVDTRNGSLIKQATYSTTQINPDEMVISPNGQYLYVGYKSSGIMSDDFIEAFEINSDNGLKSLGLVSGGYNNLSLISAGRRNVIYASSEFGSNESGAKDSTKNLFKYTINSGRLTNPVIVNGGVAPSSLALSKNNKYLYVSNKSSNIISTYSLDNFGTPSESAIKTVSTSSSPDNLVMGGDGKNLFVNNQGSSSISSFKVESSGNLSLASSTVVESSSYLNSLALATNVTSGPKLLNHFINESVNEFIEEFPADTDVNTIVANSTVNLYTTTNNNNTGSKGVQGVEQAIPLTIEGVAILATGVYVTFRAMSPLNTGDTVYLENHNIQNTNGQIENPFRTLLRVLRRYDKRSDAILYRVKPAVAKNVAVDTPIELKIDYMVTINDPNSLDMATVIDPKTVNTNTVTVTQRPSAGGVESTVAITVTSTATNLKIRPKEELNYNSTVTINVSGVKDIDGHLLNYKGSFNTLSSESPAMVYPYESTNVSLNSKIIIEFPGEIDPISVDSSTFYIKNTINGQKIPATIHIINGNNVPINSQMIVGSITVTESSSQPRSGPSPKYQIVLTPANSYFIAEEHVLHTEGVVYYIQQPGQSTAHRVSSNSSFSFITRELHELQPHVIYVATNSGQGYSGNLGGISGADQKCNTDPNRPQDLPDETPRNYKAMIVYQQKINNVYIGRYPCLPWFEWNSDGSPVCGPNVSKDWVLRQNMPYYNANREYLGSTNEQSIFSIDNFWSELDGDAQPNLVWTGFKDDRNWLADDNGRNSCNGWSANNSQYAYLGISVTTQIGEILNSGNGLCSEGYSLYCVSQ